MQTRCWSIPGSFTSSGSSDTRPDTVVRRLYFQYLKLQQLWEEYRPSGLIVIGIPCNDFDQQEPASEEEIMEFCSSNYGVTFPMTTKQTINGSGAHPLFRAMREEFTSDILPRWNFCKYLFGREGTLLHHWPSNVEPDEPGLRHEIERNLSSWSL